MAQEPIRTIVQNSWNSLIYPAAKQLSRESTGCRSHIPRIINVTSGVIIALITADHASATNCGFCLSAQAGSRMVSRHFLCVAHINNNKERMQITYA